MESEEQIGLFLVGLWFIWEERNCQMWNKKELEENEILGKAERWLTKYLEFQFAAPDQGPRQTPRWKPPEGADFKINVDAAVIADSGTGLGVVVRDRNDSFCFAGVRRSRIQWTPELADIQAIKFGLEVAIEKGFISGEIESDCLREVQQIKKEEMSLTEEGDECEEVKARLDELGGSVTIRFAGREANQVAHIMCRWDDSEYWASRPPIFLVDQLILGSCNISS
ncbi:unnamed protein product [Linum trigynum]|uniref:RNase H type-1 domain-containing protein n=1 Tax=Linum trigynum TaxID=586398 RepID=A0AAV2GX82_9ROSI